MSKNTMTPRERALENCKDFEYTCIAKSDQGASAEIWRCESPVDFDHAYDLVITRMGICAYGDMDPLVFRNVSGRGLEFLAGNSVDYSLYSKLDESSKKTEIDWDAVHESVAGFLVRHLDEIWAPSKSETPLSGGSIKDAVDAMRVARGGAARAAMESLVDALASAAPEDSTAWPSEGRWTRRAAVKERISSLLGDLEEVTTVDDLHQCLSLADSGFNGLFGDFEYEGITRPGESVLTRLHMLNIGARRILDIQAQQDAPDPEVQRERG